MKEERIQKKLHSSKKSLTDPKNYVKNWKKTYLVSLKTQNHSNQFTRNSPKTYSSMNKKSSMPWKLNQTLTTQTSRNITHAHTARIILTCPMLRKKGIKMQVQMQEVITKIFWRRKMKKLKGVKLIWKQSIISRRKLNNLNRKLKKKVI